MIYDKDIREPLFDYLEETYGKTRIFEEKNMGNSRADIVMLTDHAIYGIEIKSDADTYARLNRQVKDYNQFFDYNYVVVGSTHGAHIKEHVPEFWGIITVEEIDGELDFYCLRLPKENPNRKWEKKLSLLWRPELVELQEKTNMPKYAGKSKAFVVEKIIEKVSEEERNTLFCQILFERDYETIHERINEYRKATNQKPRRRRKYKRIKRAK